MYDVVAEGGEFRPKWKALPEKGINRDGKRETDYRANKAGDKDRGKGETAEEKQEGGVGDKEKSKL